MCWEISCSCDTIKRWFCFCTEEPGILACCPVLLWSDFRCRTQFWGSCTWKTLNKCTWKKVISIVPVCGELCKIKKNEVRLQETNYRTKYDDLKWSRGRMCWAGRITKEILNSIKLNSPQVVTNSLDTEWQQKKKKHQAVIIGLFCDHLGVTAELGACDEWIPEKSYRRWKTMQMDLFNTSSLPNDLLSVHSLLLNSSFVGQKKPHTIKSSFRGLRHISRARAPIHPPTGRTVSMMMNFEICDHITSSSGWSHHHLMMMIIRMMMWSQILGFFLSNRLWMKRSPKLRNNSPAWPWW